MEGGRVVNREKQTKIRSLKLIYSCTNEAKRRFITERLSGNKGNRNDYNDLWN